MKDYSWYHNKALNLSKRDSFYDDISSLFCKELISFDVTCEKLIESFANHYFLSESRLEKEEAIEVSSNFFALMTSDFTDEMDFSAEQWDFIRDLTLSYQNELSIETLSSILGVLTTRKKIVF